MIKTNMSACFLAYYEVHGDIQGPNLVKNMPNMQILTTRILNIQIGASILCGDIFNDYLWSYMIETDMSACVLTFYRICDNLWDKKLVKIVAKIQVLSPLNPEYLICCLDISMVICD